MWRDLDMRAREELPAIAKTYDLVLWLLPYGVTGRREVSDGQS